MKTSRNNLGKRLFGSILFLFAGMMIPLLAYAQQSDYQIIQEFNSSYSSLLEDIEGIDDTTEIAQTVEDINAFNDRFDDHRELINAAVYPDTYSSRLAILHDRFRIVQENLNTIGQLNRRVAELTEELEAYENRLNELDQTNSRLLNEIEASQNSEEELSGLVNQYRQNLQERDRFVAGFLEDLLNRYSQMDAAAIDELSESATRLDETPLELIETILGEYIIQAGQESGLETIDFLRMKAQYTYFQDVWENIGERLSQLFNPENQVQAEQRITDLLNTWNTRIEDRLWNALSASFSNQGISLESFNSSDEFHEALISHINQATANSREVNTDEDYQKFRHFFSFWNEQFKTEWGDLLTNGNLLSYQQMASVDRELEEWNTAALPTSNLMLILLLISIAVVVGLVILLIRKK